MLLLLRRALSAGSLRRARAPAPAATLPAPRLLLLARLTGHLRRTWLLRPLLLLLLRRTWPALAPGLLLLSLLRLLLLAGTRSALALSFARLLRLALVAPRSLAGALLEFAHLLLHEPLRLPCVLQPELVVAAVRAPLPSLGIGLLA